MLIRLTQQAIQDLEVAREARNITEIENAHCQLRIRLEDMVLADVEKKSNDFKENWERVIQQGTEAKAAVDEVLILLNNIPSKHTKTDAVQQWVPIKFDGDPNKWPQFWPSWSEVVDKNATLTDLAKAKMLFDCSTGKAKEVIGEMSVMAEHLTDMKNALLNAFNDPTDLYDTNQKTL